MLKVSEADGVSLVRGPGAPKEPDRFPGHGLCGDHAASDGPWHTACARVGPEIQAASENKGLIRGKRYARHHAGGHVVLSGTAASSTWTRMRSGRPLRHFPAADLNM